MLSAVSDYEQQELHISDPRINDRIRVPEVRLVGPNGEQVGVVRIEDALRLAAESDLDLVEVAPTAKPPVCKLMDFGKYKYEAAVKAREARKNQTNTILKEVRFRLKIDKHDYETKTGHALRFLGAGDKVKAMIQFRGREQQRPEMGIRLLNKFAEDVAAVGVVESSPRIDGRNMVMVVGPLKNKAEAKAEARRQAQRETDKAKATAVKEGRVDTSDDKPAMTQSLGDNLPEEFQARLAQVEADNAEQAKKDAEQAKKDAEAAKAAPVAEAPKAEAPKVAAPKAAAPKAETAKAPAPKAAEAKAEDKPAAAAPKAAAAKPAAAPKPVAAPKPAPKPTATPKPAPKPAPRTTPKPRQGK